MRRALSATVLALLMSSSTVPLAAQRWDATIDSAMAAAGIPGRSALVLHDDNAVLTQGYGIRRLGESAPVTRETLFQVGSLTKAVRATAIAILVGAGLLAWDDQVQQHVRQFRLRDPWVSSHMIEECRS